MHSDFSRKPNTTKTIGKTSYETQAIKPFKSLPKEYAALCRWHLPRPIHDAPAYENTVEIVEAFAGFEDAMNADQRNYLDLLADLVGEYEDKTVAKAEPSTTEKRLKFCSIKLDGVARTWDVFLA